MSNLNQTLLANAIRMLAIDAVQQANSGHPGAPMGMADMAVALWQDHLKHNPNNPRWVNRDRFVLSNGHASMLLYAVLHLTGYDLPLDEIRNFRQWGSKTPGHPEVDITPGVETTTGPLGQGLANAVGMALAEKLLAKEFNKPDFEVVDHHTYVFVGDGCLMEGVSHEVCALAGAWRLNKLVALYDSNSISIDGKVAPWYVDDVKKRFEAYQWDVIDGVDGHDAGAVSKAIAQAKRSTDKPTMIVCKTHIGFGSPNRADTSKAHGEPLGAEEVKLTREKLGWKDEPFVIPQAIYAGWDAKAAGEKAESAWDGLFEGYVKAHPEAAQKFARRMERRLPAQYQKAVKRFVAQLAQKAETVATRKASQQVLEVLTKELPELLGGSADLTGSNLTLTKSMDALRVDAKGGVVDLAEGKTGYHINYGVREFGMAAIMNGVALHEGFIPYGGTFLTFSDYSRNALRMAALMKQRVIHVFTHDSIGLGEDGPTHQSIEHAESLRLIPNMDVWRPADAEETAVAWTKAVMSPNGPTALLLSRQGLPYLPKMNGEAIAKGGYVLAEPTEVGLKKKAQIILIATGSEVHLALQAQVLLAKDKIAARVVSMPSTTTFDQQGKVYKASVLPAKTPCVAIEAGIGKGWYKYGCVDTVTMESYGESAPADVLFKHFGFTPENVVKVAKKALKK
ncbi:MAG: transketolase [Saezia sp.]